MGLGETDLVNDRSCCLGFLFLCLPIKKLAIQSQGCENIIKFRILCHLSTLLIFVISTYVLKMIIFTAGVWAYLGDSKEGETEEYISVPHPRAGKGGDYSKRKGERRVLRLKALL